LLMIVQLGANPCYRRSAGTEPVGLERGVEVELAAGDVVFLLVLEIGYRVQVTPPSPPRVGRAPPNRATSSVLFSDDDDEEGNGKPSAAASAPARLKKCMYGANCYRKNKQHLAEYWHPGKEEDLSNSRLAGSKRRSPTTSPQRGPTKRARVVEDSDSDDDREPRAGGLRSGNAARFQGRQSSPLHKPPPVARATPAVPKPPQPSPPTAAKPASAVAPKAAAVAPILVPAVKKTIAASSKEITVTAASTGHKQARLFLVPLGMGLYYNFDREVAWSTLARKLHDFLASRSGANLAIDVCCTLEERELLRTDAIFSKHPRVRAFRQEQLGSLEWSKYTAVVVPVNWRFKAIGPAAKAFLAWADGAAAAAKAAHSICMPGLVRPVDSKGLEALFVNAPTMNADKPNCLDGNYVEGTRLIEDCYRGIIEAFSLHC